MKKFVSVLFAVVLLATALAAAPNAKKRVKELEAQVADLEGQNAELAGQVEMLQGQNAVLKEIAGVLPASLDALMPPANEQPVYLLEMFAMAMPLEAMMADAQQQDAEGVMANFEAFKVKYQEVSGLVPEWQERFPTGPVDALGEALAAGDPAAIEPAMMGLGQQVCGGCHLTAMASAQHKYQWKPIGEANFANPMSGEEMPLMDFMIAMSGAYAGIGNDLQQGQPEAAQANFEAFSAFFDGMEKGCENCHETPREYYIDDDSKKDVAALGKMLKKPPKDPADMQNLMMKIGEQSCAMCHLVHVPAAMAEMRHQFMGDLLE